MTIAKTPGVRYDAEAEEAVLGAMLISGEAIRVVRDICDSGDFYVPTHALIFGAIVALFDEGRAVDAVTVTDELRHVGALDKVGDPSLFVSLQANTPSVTHARHYADIVRREGVARTLQRGLAEAQRTLSDYVDPVEVAEGVEAFMGGLVRAGKVPRGFWTTTSGYGATDRSETLTPLADGVCYPLSRIMVVAGEKGGKALALDTPVPTPRGWSTMGDLEVGDEVFGPDGKARRVMAATEAMHGHDCYRVIFKDGREIVADAGHLWDTVSYAERQHGRQGHGIRTTRELAEAVSVRGGHTWNHQIPTADPLHFEPLGPLPITPYTFGAWLGDGDSVHAQMTSADPQIMEEVAGEGWRVVKGARYRWRITNDTMRDGFEARCRRMGVWGNKHIPEVYLRAPVADRVSLLQGLMDTDGTISDERGMSRCEFSVCNRRLAEDFRRLVTELGIKSSWREAPAKLYGKVVGTRYRIAFQASMTVFRLSRKADKTKPPITPVSLRRAVVAVVPVASVPVRCIQVDDPDGMYLAGDGCVPTHNSILLRQMAFCLAAGLHPFNPRVKIDPVRTLIFDAENDDDELVPTMERIRQMVVAYGAEGSGEPALYSVPYGVDLESRRDRADLYAVLEECRPQIIIGGPIYKLTDQTQDYSEDRRAAIVQRVCNDIRKRWGTAFILEHHAPTGSGRGREIRGKGGQVWAAWVNMTVGLHPAENGDGLDVRYPHRPRGLFAWPKRFDRGTPYSWPWTPVMRTPVLDIQPSLGEPPPAENDGWDGNPF